MRTPHASAILILSLLAVAGGCATSPPPSADALWKEYEAAVRDSAVHGPASSVPLHAIGPDERQVTVATFTEWGAPASPLTRYTWVSLPEQLHELCHGKDDAVLAIQMILGLPPQAAPSRADHRWQVITLRVPREYVFRPCPGGTDIAAPRCSAASVAPADAATTSFLLQQLWSSYHEGGTLAEEKADPGYPFTGMGWSYDWDPASPSHVGVSEYVLRLGAPVVVTGTASPQEFCDRE